MGDQGHLAGRGHLAIPAHPVPSHLPLTAALSAMSLSLSPTAIDVRLGPEPPLGTPPGPPLPSGFSASATPPSPLVFRRSGPPSITTPGT